MRKSAARILRFARSLFPNHTRESSIYRHPCQSRNSPYPGSIRHAVEVETRQTTRFETSDVLGNRFVRVEQYWIVVRLGDMIYVDTDYDGKPETVKAILEKLRANLTQTPWRAETESTAENG